MSIPKQSQIKQLPLSIKPIFHCVTNFTKLSINFRYELRSVGARTIQISPDMSHRQG